MPLRIEGGTPARRRHHARRRRVEPVPLGAPDGGAARSGPRWWSRSPSLTSRPYVDVTLAAAVGLRRPHRAGGPPGLPGASPSALRGGRARVEGDYSAACYPAAAAALTGGEVILDGLSPRLPPGGPRVHRPPRRDGRRGLLEGRGPAHPRPASCGGSRPTSPACPTRCPPSRPSPPSPRGETLIHNVAHLRIKESDRLEAMATGLQEARRRRPRGARQPLAPRRSGPAPSRRPTRSTSIRAATTGSP